MSRIRIVAAAALIASAALVVFALVFRNSSHSVVEREGKPVGGVKVLKSENEWQQLLTPEQFRVARQGGTERPYTNEYANTKTDGVYVCVCCAQPLYDANAKFDSGTGWPSFWEPVAEDNISTFTDRGALMVRTEVKCSRCDAHLGHVFGDGPAPTGKRHCMNSAALRLLPRSP